MTTRHVPSKSEVLVRASTPASMKYSSNTEAGPVRHKRHKFLGKEFRFRWNSEKRAERLRRQLAVRSSFFPGPLDPIRNDTSTKACDSNRPSKHCESNDDGLVK